MFSYTSGEKDLELLSLEPSSHCSPSSNVSPPQLVEPQTIVWVRKGLRNAWMYRTASQSSLISAGRVVDDSGIDQALKVLTPAYSLEVGFSAMTLYAGDAFYSRGSLAWEQPTWLMEVTNEGLFTTSSTYREGQSGKRVHMYRATKEMGIEPDGLLSWRRTFDDFDGLKYKWRMTILSNHYCTRLADGVEVASFSRNNLSFNYERLGTFTLHRAVPEKTLHLLLATCAMCYQLRG